MIARPTEDEVSRLPLVSIGLPVFNGEEFIGAAIDSILGQTLGNFELIISDNCSTDNTEEICRGYAQKDSRIRYTRAESNRGAAWNFNRVLQLAEGTYSKWAAADDVLVESFLERCYEILVQYPDVSIAYTGVMYIDEAGREVEPYGVKLRTDSPVRLTRLWDLMMAGHKCFEIFGLFRTDQVRYSGGMPPHPHGDGILLERLAVIGRFHEIPEYLFHSRRHASQSGEIFGGFNVGPMDYHGFARWFDPTNNARYLFPTWRIFREHLGVVRHGGLAPVELACAAALLGRWLVRWRGHLTFDLRYAIRQWVSSIRT